MSRRLYKAWHHMISRCLNGKDKCFKHYGGRGIKVCEEWKTSFDNFKEWALSNGYDETLTLDRIDVNENYEPTNCRWTDWKSQQRNKRNNHLVEYKGEIKCLCEWCEELGLDYTRTKQRLYRGMTAEKAFYPNQLTQRHNEKGQFVWT